MNKELLALLRANTTTQIEVQVEPTYTQVAVWCQSFGKDWSICYQNGDACGGRKGEAVFTNAGADGGLKELRAILEDIPNFKVLIDSETYWSYESLDELINEFCSQFAEENNIARYFEHAEGMNKIIVTLDQDAYIDQGGAPAATYYTAIATDPAGNKYRIIWEITLSEEDQAECDDESNMCDWDDYTATALANNAEVSVVIKW